MDIDSYLETGPNQSLEDLGEILEQQQYREQRRLQSQIRKLDRELQKQERAAQREKARLDREISQLRNRLAGLDDVHPMWQPQSRRDRKLAIQQNLQRLIERRTELEQETLSSRFNAFMEKIELERELQELKDSSVQELLRELEYG